MPELRNRRHELFCRAYLLEPIGWKAVIKAGYKPAYADECQRRLLRRSDIQDRLAELHLPGDLTFEAAASRVARRIWDIATVDMRELVQLRVAACRYCHGKDHKFQWRTLREYKVALAKALEGLGLDQSAPDPADNPSWPSLAGGFGYRQTREPIPDCPECDGLGEPYITVTPSSHLTERQASVYSGAKQTAYGVQVVTKDQIRALSLLAQLFLKDAEPSRPPPDTLSAGLAEIRARMASAAPIRAAYAADES